MAANLNWKENNITCKLTILTLNQTIGRCIKANLSLSQTEAKFCQFASLSVFIIFPFFAESQT